MTCHQCGCQLVNQGVWHDATDDQRAEWRASGCAPLATKQACRNCYQRIYRRTGGCVRTQLQEAS